MTEERAAKMMVMEIPRPLWRVCVNSALSSMLGKAWSATTPVAKETSMPHQQPSRRHPDLFASREPPVSIATSERTKLLALVSALLAETVAVVRAEASDEDHA
jgi:hypothetical protein